MLSCYCTVPFCSRLLLRLVSCKRLFVLCHDFSKTGKGRRWPTDCPFTSDNSALTSILQIRAGLFPHHAELLLETGKMRYLFFAHRKKESAGPLAGKERPKERHAFLPQFNGTSLSYPTVSDHPVAGLIIASRK